MKFPLGCDADTFRGAELQRSPCGLCASLRTVNCNVVWQDGVLHVRAAKLVMTYCCLYRSERYDKLVRQCRFQRRGHFWWAAGFKKQLGPCCRARSFRPP